MRILFIHEVNYLNKVIFEMHEFPELLALAGHEVSFFHYPERPDRRRVSLRARHEPIPGRVHPEASIRLITAPTFGGHAMERYVAPLLVLPTLSREIHKGRYDAIVLYAVPTLGWQAVSIAKRAGVPVLFRALDVSHKIRASLFAPLIRMAERYIYRNADLVSANNPAMAEYCRESSGRTGPTVVNVPPVDLSHFSGPAEPAMRVELEIPASGKVLLYMGTFFGFCGLDRVVEAMPAELAKHPDLFLVLVGGGELDAFLRKRVAELGIGDRVVFTGVVPYAKLPRYLKVADVAINPFRPELLTNVALPHKILQYMAAGVPTVSTSLSGIRGLLGEDSGVTWAASQDAVAETAASLSHATPKQLASIASTQARKVTELFSQKAALGSFEESLRAVR